MHRNVIILMTTIPSLHIHIVNKHVYYVYTGNKKQSAGLTGYVESNTKNIYFYTEAHTQTQPEGPTQTEAHSEYINVVIFITELTN